MRSDCHLWGLVPGSSLMNMSDWHYRRQTIYDSRTRRLQSRSSPPVSGCLAARRYKHDHVVHRVHTHTRTHAHRHARTYTQTAVCRCDTRNCSPCQGIIIPSLLPEHVARMHVRCLSLTSRPVHCSHKRQPS